MLRNIGFSFLLISGLAAQETYEPGVQVQNSVMIWYPAAKADRSMTISDYIKLSGLNSSPYLWIQRAVSGSNGLDSLSIMKLLKHPMSAQLRAEPAAGRFPLVIWSLRHESQLYQMGLNEFLAQHGFVVAAFIEPLSPPWTVQVGQKADALSGMTAHWEQELGRVKKLPWVDSTRIAILSWSYAGESAEHLVVDEANIDLVISLSSNFLGNRLYETGRLEPAKIRVPIVMLSERTNTRGQTVERPIILDSLSREWYFIRFDSLAHGNFNFIEGWLPAQEGVSTVQPWVRPGLDAANGYQDVQRLCLYFLDAIVRRGQRNVGYPVLPKSVETLK